MLLYHTLIRHKWSHSNFANKFPRTLCQVLRLNPISTITYTFIPTFWLNQALPYLSWIIGLIFSCDNYQTSSSVYQQKGIWKCLHYLFLNCFSIWYSLYVIHQAKRVWSWSNSIWIFLIDCIHHMQNYLLLLLYKDLLSLVPKADSKIVQLDFLGVAVVFFSFISCLKICFFLFIFIDTMPACL